MRVPRLKTPKAGTVGLDIDSGYVAAVQAGSDPVRAASADLPAGAVSGGEVVDSDAVAATLKELFSRHDLPRMVQLGLANQQISVRQLELPMIADPSELEQAVRFQAAEAIAMPLQDAVLDYQVARVFPGEAGGERMQVVVVAARRAMIDQLLAATKSAGLKPVGIDLAAFALVRATADRTGGDEGRARMLCHLGGVSNLAIAVGATCAFTRTLPIPWGDSAVAHTASTLAAEVRLSLDSYMSQLDAVAVQETLISGPGAHVEGLAEELGAELGMPVAVAPPFGVLGSPELPPEEDPYRHTVAAGLALAEAA